MSSDVPTKAIEALTCRLLDHDIWTVFTAPVCLF